MADNTKLSSFSIGYYVNRVNVIAREMLNIIINKPLNERIIKARIGEGDFKKGEVLISKELCKGNRDLISLKTNCLNKLEYTKDLLQNMVAN